MSEMPQVSYSNYGTTTCGTPLEPWNVPEDRAGLFGMSNAVMLTGLKPVDPPDQQSMPNQTRRIVQVFIVDPDENVPLAESVLHQGTQQLTDATDQELFFGVPIAEILKAHNEKRAKWLDKCASKKSGKEIYLEPARIRDLKMLVVNVAAF